MLRSYKVKLPGKFCVVLFPFLAVDVFPGSSRMLCADHTACLKSALFLRLLSCVMTTSLNPGPSYCLGPVFPWRRALNLMDLWAVPHQLLVSEKAGKMGVSPAHCGALWRADKGGDTVLSRTLNLEQTQQVGHEKTDPSRGPSGN